MPNRCENDITITGPVDDVKKVKSYIKRESFFNNFCRRPKKYDKDGRYEWNNAHRGTKRDTSKKSMYVCDFNEYNFKAELLLCFDTARSPPIGAMSTLAKKHDKISISLRYSEGGMNFSGEAQRSEGELEFDECYDDYCFGRGRRCKECDGTYDPEREDDRGDDEHTICYRCRKDLQSKQTEPGK